MSAHLSTTGSEVEISLLSSGMYGCVTATEVQAEPAASIVKRQEDRPKHQKLSSVLPCHIPEDSNIIQQTTTSHPKR
jgi:hypothetical protein